MHSIKKILVARLRHHGDLLLTTPVFSALKKAYPHAHIDAYIYDETYPILEGNPSVDGFILYNKKRKKNLFAKLFYELKLLFLIRKNCYDLVINLTEGDRGALAALASKAKVRVGIDPEGSGMLGKRFCYTHLSKRCHQIRHTVERQLDVLRTLNIFPLYEERNLYFAIEKNAYRTIKKILEDKNIDQFILVHPVSRWLFKSLPVGVIKEVIAYLIASGYFVVLTGSLADEEVKMNHEIAEGFSQDRLLNLTGMVSIKELGALIDLSMLLICVDSLPLHLASALKSKVLAVFGPTSEKTWAPWKNPNARILFQDYTCRPCYMPGCANSKKSDCLETFPAKLLIREIESLLN